MKTNANHEDHELSVQELELTAAELDEVTGGFIGRFLSGGGQGGQNDPAQMFQQILQQLTQGG